MNYLVNNPNKRADAFAVFAGSDFCSPSVLKMKQYKLCALTQQRQSSRQESFLLCFVFGYLDLNRIDIIPFIQEFIWADHM